MPLCPQFLDRGPLANSVDPNPTAPEEQSDRGLQCLQFRQILKYLQKAKSICSNFTKLVVSHFQGNYGNRLSDQLVLLLWLEK